MAAARNMSDKFLLGFDAMDEVHGEFLQLVAALVAATDEQLKSALATLAAHLELHFELEDGWMTQTEFPPRECHIDEHAAVMKSVRDVQGMLVAGEEDGFATARALAMALEDWFPGHATHLDSALAHWMVKRRYGGKPVVFRRSASSAADGWSMNLIDDY